MTTIFFVLVAYVGLIIYAKKKGGFLIGGAEYIKQAKDTHATILFHGKGWGSYKTLSAVVTAWCLLKTGKYKRVYANIPVSFASSPPDDVEIDYETGHAVDFDFLAEYSKDSIFIFDECWRSLKSYDPQLISEIFAFPRKLNQVYLMTSVIPIANFRAFSRAVVQKIFNFQIFGIPAVRMGFSVIDSGPKDKPLSFFLFPPTAFFGMYSTKFRPMSINPIAQYSDKGFIYDTESRPIPPRDHDLFELDSWGQAVPKKTRKLTDEQIARLEALYPFFEPTWSDPPQLPTLKKRRSFSLQGILGTEFSFSFFIKASVLLWFLLCVASYGAWYAPHYPPPWSHPDYFLMRIPPDQWKELNSQNFGVMNYVEGLFEIQPGITESAPGQRPDSLEPVQFDFDP